MPDTKLDGVYMERKVEAQKILDRVPVIKKP